MTFVERRWTVVDGFMGHPVTPSLIVGAAAVGVFLAASALYAHPPVVLPSAFVKVLTDTGHGSATHIGNGLYVTAAHVVDGSAEVTINGIKSPVLWANSTYDIALVSGPVDVAVVPLACATPYPGQIGHAHGNPVDLEDIATSLTVAGVAREVGPWKLAIPMDGTMAPGMAGGSWVVDGALHGVNVGVAMAPTTMGLSSYYGISIIVPSSVVCALMGRV